MTDKIIGIGAEAVLIHTGTNLIKRRVKKGYRIPILDEKLRKLRTRSEAKLLEKAGKLIPTPKVKKVDDKTMEIDMEFIAGKKLSEHLDSLNNAEEVCRTIGAQIAKLHDADIIHGDLTTSNMILSKEDKLYFIDFGLGFNSAKIEDKAVDLHLIKQALEAKHFLHFENFFSAVLQGYAHSKNYKETIKRLEAVEKRGRYKQAG
jgi:TP53 regulating kinase-like protein